MTTMLPFYNLQVEKNGKIVKTRFISVMSYKKCIEHKKVYGQKFPII